MKFSISALLPVGTLLAVIASPDENIDALIAGAAKPAPAEAPEPAAAVVPPATGSPESDPAVVAVAAPVTQLQGESPQSVPTAPPAGALPRPATN